MRPLRAPRLELELARQRLAAHMFGVSPSLPRIAGYEVVERLGGGAQGDVYAVDDPKLDRTLAIKVLRESTSEWLREARALAQIAHPNVVTVLDVGVTDEADGRRGYVVMERVEGAPLDQWASRSAGTSQRLRVLLGAAEGLAAVHRAGLVHGDFKPSNVMVGSDGRARVVDFGLARSGFDDDSDAAPRNASSSHTTGFGTPGYRAPECIRRAPDARSDQYSFCATAWEILFDEPPEQRSGRRSRVALALQRGLHTDSVERWPAMEDLIARLQRVRRPARVDARVAMLALVGGTAAWLAVPVPDAPDPCADVYKAYDAVWTPSRSDAIGTAFEAAAPSFGARSWSAVQERLGPLREQWIAQRTDVCRAFTTLPEASGEPSPAGDAVQRCLTDQLEELDALFDGWARTDASGVRRAVSRIDETLAHSNCARVGAGPDDGHAAIRAELARAKGLARAGKRDEAGVRLDDLLQWAETPAAANEPLAAEILLQVGIHRWTRGDVHEARARLQAAAHAAQACGADAILARSAMTLVDLLGRRLAQFDEARIWERHARAAIDRIDDADLRDELDWKWAWISSLDGEHDTARQTLLRLLRERLDDPGPSQVHVADLYEALARVESDAGRGAAALEWATMAVRAQSERVGEDHPDYADALFRRGVAQEQRSELPAARASFEHALAIQERAGNLLRTAGTRNSLAVVLERQGDFARARREYERVLEILGDDASVAPGSIVTTHVNLGMLALAERQAEVALAQFQRAKTMADEVYAADHPTQQLLSYGLGVSRARLGQYPLAVEHLERSLTLAITLGMEAGTIAKSRYVLGQARWHLPGQRQRGVAEVKAGLATLQTDPVAYAEELAEARDWLRTRGERR